MQCLSALNAIHAADLVHRGTLHSHTVSRGFTDAPSQVSPRVASSLQPATCYQPEVLLLKL